MYRSRGLDDSVVFAAVTVETIRWGVLALVLSRLALRLQDSNLTPGFAFFRGGDALRRGVVAGVAWGVVASLVMYGLSVAEYAAGYIHTLPWPGANGEPIDIRLAIGAGLRNLVGEEVVVRLGAQAIAFYLFRRLQYAGALAILASSFYFELWHNPLEVPQFLNFAGSCVFGWAYQKHGYESAAVAHCVADWVLLGILPVVLFRPL